MDVSTSRGGQRPRSRAAGRTRWTAAAVWWGLGAVSCAATGDAVPAAVPSDLPVQSKAPDEVLHDNPDWRARYREVHIEPEAIRALVDAPPGARVVILYGVWCPDSRYAVPVLWRAFDEARERADEAPSAEGGDSGLPFEVVHVDVDEDKASSTFDLAPYDLKYVPTVIVYRQGEEVGRIVETAPNGVLTDFINLLYGSTTGVVSARDDL